jgi:hypothetical protein
MNTLSQMKRQPLVTLVAAAMAATALAGPPARAAAIEESVSVQPPRPLTPKEEEVLSSAGAKVLQHVAEARARLARKDSRGAGEELDQAEKLLDIIQAAVPATVVKDRIEVPKKGLEYENSRTVQPDLIPLYNSLEEVADYMPLKPTRTTPGEHAKVTHPEGKSARVEETTDAALKYTELDLPLHAIRSFVDAARGDLAKGKPDEADASLKAVEQGVVYVSVAVEQPLFVARNLMEQASIDLEKGRKDLAQNNLQAAIVQLEQAEKSSDPYTREGAQALLKEARTLQADMRAGNDVGRRMRGLWQHTKAYAERAVEYMRTGWSRMRSVSPFKDELIEVKRYLSDAEIDLFIGKEPAKARHDMQKALANLDGAASHAQTYYTDPIYKQQIADLQKTVRGMMGNTPVANQQQFEAAKDELSRMIRSL